MAKASKEEWEQAMRFVNDLEMEIKYPEKTDEELREWLNKAPCLTRIVFGYQVMIDNVCDPDEDTLACKPEIVAAMQAYKKTAEVTVPEVTPPTFTETLENGKVVQVHPRASVRLCDQARNAIEAIHCWTDRAVFTDLQNDRDVSPRAVMQRYQEAVRALDVELAELCVPRLTGSWGAQKEGARPL